MSQTEDPTEENAWQQQALATLNDQALTAADLASLTRMRGLYEELTPPRLSRLVLTRCHFPTAKERGSPLPVSTDDPPLTPDSDLEMFRRYGSSSKPQ